MTRMRKRPEAEADLIEIASYIAQDDSTAADHLIDSITEKFHLLADHPAMGRVRDELAPSLRSFAADPYVIFYRPTENGIDIVRVLHSARDIPALF